MRLAEPQALHEQLSMLWARRPPRFLAALVVGQWILLLLLVRRTTHNGWFFYQGGAETLSYSTAWSLA